MNSKLCITMFALLCVAASAGMAFAASTYEVRWYQSASCVDGSKCTYSEVSGYVKGYEAVKMTIAPLQNQSWQSMTLKNMDLNPLQHVPWCSRRSTAATMRANRRARPHPNADIGRIRIVSSCPATVAGRTWNIIPTPDSE